MLAIIEFLPLLLFFAAYIYKDIYFALIVLMVAMPFALAAKFLRTGKLDNFLMWSTILVIFAGALTFYFNDPTFLYLKPTALYWAFAVAFVMSMWVGEKPLVRRFFEVAGDLPTEQLDDRQWRTLNLVWAAFFVAMGILNLYVAYNYPESFWVKFKVFGMTGVTIVFMFAQSIWIFSKMNLANDTDNPEQE